MKKPRLMDQVRNTLCVHHYSIRTEQAYTQWIRRFICFHNKRHPKDMGKAEVEAFLTHLAVKKNVSASTQNQPLAALLFLYQKVLRIDLDWIEDVVRVKNPVRVPTVLSKTEVKQLLAALQGEHKLLAHVIYGTKIRAAA